MLRYACGWVFGVLGIFPTVLRKVIIASRWWRHVGSIPKRVNYKSYHSCTEDTSYGHTPTAEKLISLPSFQHDWGRYPWCLIVGNARNDSHVVVATQLHVGHSVPILLPPQKLEMNSLDVLSHGRHFDTVSVVSWVFNEWANQGIGCVRLVWTLYVCYKSSAHSAPSGWQWCHFDYW